MKLKEGKCPKCGSGNTTKEKIMGSDTGDIVCNDCNYVGHWREFFQNEKTFLWEKFINPKDNVS